MKHYGNCRTVAKLLKSLPLSELGANERSLVETHLDSCPGCQSLAARMLHLDRELALLCTEAPEYRIEASHSGRPSRLRYLGFGAVFMVAALAGAGFGFKYGVGSLFGEAYAAPLPGQVRGLPNAGFEEGRLMNDPMDWKARFPNGSIAPPIASWRQDNGDTPNFYEFDEKVGHDGHGRSLKLYLRSFGGWISRTVPGPFPARTLVSMRTWVYMPRPGSTRNKWLSFGIGANQAGGPVAPGWSAGLDVFDASPTWRPYTLVTSLPYASESIVFSFSTGAGDGTYKGWDLAAWIDDVEVAVSVPVKGTARGHGNVVTVRVTTPVGFTVSEAPEDLKLLTYGNRLPPLVPKSVRRFAGQIVCTYEAGGLRDLLAEGNPDTKEPDLPAQVKLKLSRGQLSFEGSCGLYVKRVDTPTD